MDTELPTDTLQTEGGLKAKFDFKSWQHILPLVVVFVFALIGTVLVAKTYTPSSGPDSSNQNSYLYENSPCQQSPAAEYGQYEVRDGTVCFGEWPVPPADAASFEVIAEGYAKDKNYVYIFGTPVHGTDLGSVGVHNGVLYDKDHIYSNAGSSNYSVIVDAQELIVSDADPLTYKILEDEGSGYFATDKDSVFFGGTVIPNADPLTFAFVLGGNDNETGVFLSTSTYNGYSKDARAVYCLDRGPGPGPNGTNIVALGGVDPATFTVVRTSPTLDAYIWGSRFAKDKNYVYNQCDLWAGVDAASFQAIPGSVDAKDNKNIYCYAPVTNQDGFIDISLPDYAQYKAVPGDDPSVCDDLRPEEPDDLE